MIVSCLAYELIPLMNHWKQGRSCPIGMVISRDIQHELLNQHMSESFTRKWFSSRIFQNIDEKIFNDPNGLSSKLNYCTRFPKQRIYELIYRLIGCYYCDSIETGSPCLVCLISWFLTVLLLFQIIYIMEDFIFHVSISFFRL